MELLIQKLKDRIALLDQIQSDDQRLWGVMHPQNIIEHLGGIMLMTAKGIDMPAVFSGEKAAIAKARFFGSYYPFPRNVKMPGTQDQPTSAPTYRFDNRAEADTKLQKALDIFLHHLNENPDQTSIHGYFGDMTQAEWLDFHIKHTEHHLQQFGVLHRDEKIPVIEKLLYKISRDIQSDTPAQWGQMNAHQMIEHLGMVFALSTDKINFPQTVDKEASKKYWDGFIQSDNPWKEVFPSKEFGDPRPPRKPTIEDSKVALQKTFKNYLSYCEDNPDAIQPHFFLGQLTVDQWRQVHVKHLQHHARQFGMDV